MKLLVFGFEDFRGLPNSSRILVENLESVPGYDLVTGVLPVTWEGTFPRFRELVDEHDPDIVLGFGAGHKQPLRIENYARNQASTRRKDNLGKMFSEEEGPIIPIEEGPKAYAFDLDDITQALRAERVAHFVSRNAGDYLCNLVTFSGANYLADTPLLFSHIHPGNAPFFDIQRGIKVMADVLRNSVGSANYQEGFPSYVVPGLESAQYGSEHVLSVEPGFSVENTDGVQVFGFREKEGKRHIQVVTRYDTLVEYGPVDTDLEKGYRLERQNEVLGTASSDVLEVNFVQDAGGVLAGIPFTISNS